MLLDDSFSLPLYYVQMLTIVKKDGVLRYDVKPEKERKKVARKPRKAD